MQIVKSLLLLACFWMSFSGSASEVHMHQSVDRVSLTPDMEYMLDTSAALSWREALTASRYQAVDQESLMFGLTDAVLWVRVHLHNPESVIQQRQLQIDTVRLEQVTLHRVDAEGRMQILHNGVAVPPPLRPIAGRNILFPLSLEPDASTTLLLRVQSRTPLTFKAVLWSTEAQERSDRQEQLISLLSIGILLGFCLYAIFLYPLHRDRAHLLLGVLMATLALFQFSYLGYSYFFLWDNSPEWALRAPAVFSNLAALFFILFIREFMPIHAQLGGRAVNSLAVLVVLLLLLLFANLSGFAFEAVGLVMGPLYLLALLVPTLMVGMCAWKGYRPAQITLVGFSLPIINTLLRVGELHGVVPPAPIYTYSVTITPILVTLIFLAAIRKRVDLIQQERDSAHDRILSMQIESANHLEREIESQTIELRGALDRAENANRAKEELLARVSHELRSPLHNILGYTNLLFRENVSRHVFNYLSRIQQGGQHLSDLIDDLLDYAQAERGKFVLQPTNTLLYPLLDQIGAEGALLCRRSQNRWAFHVDEALPVAVSVDSRHLRQILLALLSNAAKYTEHGTISLHVTAVEHDEAEACLKFEVVDSGKGIAKDQLEQIFLPFTRGESSGRSDGLGLGLSISQQILHAMGGELQVESTPGAGSRFWFQLHLQRISEEEVPVEPGVCTYTGYLPPVRTILIVEDNAVHLEFMLHLLEDLGFQCQSATTIAESRRLIEQQPFDLAILDQQLPDGTAWDLLQQLKVSPALASIPTILLSATQATPPADWNHDNRFDVIHKKPVSVSALLADVGDLLELQWHDQASQPSMDGVPSISEVDGEMGEMTPVERLQQLEVYSREGAIYEIERWIREAREGGDFPQSLLSELERLLEQLDFDAMVEPIKRLHQHVEESAIL